MKNQEIEQLRVNYIITRTLMVICAALLGSVTALYHMEQDQLNELRKECTEAGYGKYVEGYFALKPRKD